MSKKSDDTLNEIEEAQAGLRQSIASAKKYSEQTDRLIKRHRKEMQKEAQAERDKRP